MDPATVFRALAMVSASFILLVQAAHAQATNPCAILDSYEHAWAQQNLDGALAHLADDAVVTVYDARTRSLTDHRSIRDFLRLAGLRSVPILTSSRTVDGNRVTWSERTDRVGQVMAGRDLMVEAVVQNGKIQSLVYRPGTLVATTGQVGAPITLETAGMAAGGLLLLGSGLLSLAGARPRVRSGSRLRGRLLSSLGQWRRSYPQ